MLEFIQTARVLHVLVLARRGKKEESSLPCGSSNAYACLPDEKVIVDRQYEINRQTLLKLKLSASSFVGFLIQVLQQEISPHVCPCTLFIRLLSSPPLACVTRNPFLKDDVMGGLFLQTATVLCRYLCSWMDTMSSVRVVVSESEEALFTLSSLFVSVSERVPDQSHLPSTGLSVPHLHCTSSDYA